MIAHPRRSGVKEPRPIDVVKPKDLTKGVNDALRAHGQERPSWREENGRRKMASTEGWE